MKRNALHSLILIAALALSGCYLPNKFELTMQIAPDGRYAIGYDGTLTQLQFLQRLGSGELKGDAVDEYVGIYENNIRRNSGFKEVSYLGNAEYQVKFERQGSLARDKQFSFPSRRGIILGLRRWTAEIAQTRVSNYQSTGHPALPALGKSGLLREPHIMEIFGDQLPERMRQDLAQNGFWVQGSIRIWTSAKVGYHNADQVIPGSPSLYIWDVDDLNDQAPHMIMAWTPPETQ